jgi:hypothetical protein
MTHPDAIRFLHHEAQVCRDRNSAEAICLLLPALLRVLHLQPMDDFEAGAFRYRLSQQHRMLRELEGQTERQELIGK